MYFLVTNHSILLYLPHRFTICFQTSSNNMFFFFDHTSYFLTFISIHMNLMKVNTFMLSTPCTQSQSLGHSMPINDGHEVSSSGSSVSGQLDIDGIRGWGKMGLDSQPRLQKQRLFSFGRILTYNWSICHPSQRQNVGFPHCSLSPCCLDEKCLSPQSSPCQNVSVLTYSLLQQNYLSSTFGKFVDSDNFHFMLSNVLVCL